MNRFFGLLFLFMLSVREEDGYMNMFMNGGGDGDREWLGDEHREPWGDSGEGESPVGETSGGKVKTGAVRYMSAR